MKNEIKEIKDSIQVISQSMLSMQQVMIEMKGGLLEVKEELRDTKDGLKVLDVNVQQVQSGLKTEIQQVFKIVVSEQELNAYRYHELKRDLEEVNSKMATKDELNKVFESLSHDIVTLSTEHRKLKKDVNHLKKNIAH